MSWKTKNISKLTTSLGVFEQSKIKRQEQNQQLMQSTTALRRKKTVVRGLDEKNLVGVTEKYEFE